MIRQVEGVVEAGFAVIRPTRREQVLADLLAIEEQLVVSQAANAQHRFGDFLIENEVTLEDRQASRLAAHAVRERLMMPAEVVHAVFERDRGIRR